MTHSDCMSEANATGGTKADTAKVRVDLIPHEAFGVYARREPDTRATDEMLYWWLNRNATVNLGSMLGVLGTSLQEIARVLTFGAQKYGDRNWEKGIVYSRVYAAFLRHMLASENDPDARDEETGLRHRAHAGCCVLFLWTYEQRGMTPWDDRPGAA